MTNSTDNTDPYPDTFRITLPELSEGQTGWRFYRSINEYETPTDGRRFHTRIIYRVLMWIHGKAESLWHWAYYTSRQYTAPESRVRGQRHTLIATVNKNGRCATYSIDPSSEGQNASPAPHGTQGEGDKLSDRNRSILDGLDKLNDKSS